MKSNKRRSIRNQLILFICLFLLLFIFIGILTTLKPAHRLSSSLYTRWTSHLEKEGFVEWLQAENKTFQVWMGDKIPKKDWRKQLWHSATNIQFTNMVSFLRTEFPGFATYEYEVIIANDQIDDWRYLTAESGPPLEQVMKDREAIDQTKDKQIAAENIEEKVVFLYNSHNRESFLPHLPNERNANDAYHEEVNITKVSERMATLLEKEGIGSITDDTDVMAELHERGWTFGRSYDVSREIVQTAMADHQQLHYFFDIHRDSLPKDRTTIKVDNKAYASILFVIGAEHKDYEKNLTLATTLHERLNEKYPNISRGVITKEGANANGIYNQDLNEQAILIEVGGHENTLDEMYETAEAFVNVFSSYYWDAIKVDKTGE